MLENNAWPNPGRQLNRIGHFPELLETMTRRDLPAHLLYKSKLELSENWSLRWGRNARLIW